MSTIFYCFISARTRNCERRRQQLKKKSLTQSAASKQAEVVHGVMTKTFNLIKACSNEKELLHKSGWILGPEKRFDSSFIFSARGTICE